MSTENRSALRVSLPTWDDCKKAVDGGYATHLQHFIYHNEPSDTDTEGFQTEAEFREQLANLIAYERQGPAPIPQSSNQYCSRYMDDAPGIRADCASHLAKGRACTDCQHRDIRTEVRDLRERLAPETTALPEADWLWGQLMDWCSRRRVHPSDYNDLFAIVGAARRAVKSNEQPSAPAVVRPTLSEPPSLGSAAGVDLTISRPPQ